MGPKGLDTIRIPLEEMTETELKDELRSHRANLSGTKDELLVRLAEIYLQEDTNVILWDDSDSMDEDDSSDGASSSEEEEEDEKMYEVTIVESTVVHLHVMASTEDEARERALEGEGERVGERAGAACFGDQDRKRTPPPRRPPGPPYRCMRCGCGWGRPGGRSSS